MLNITNFGARGDAVHIQANTLNGSRVVTVSSTNALSDADAGKLILLFGIGPATTPTNHQDFIGRIIRVLNGTNVTLSAPAGCTATQVTGICGTQNAEALQKCVDACSGSNTVVNIPAGNYLLVPTNLLNPDYVMRSSGETQAAVAIRKGGIHFLGDDRDDTVLIGCGAWQLKTNHVIRGQLFVCQGPVTNDAPLIFENLTMDGGLANGSQSYHGFPARTTDGAGWDLTHDAVIDRDRPPLHLFKAFRNCRFIHWRGEMLKSVVTWTNGFIEVSHCDFEDGNASAFNFSFSHDINNCTFSNLDMAMEFYEGYMAGPSVFENSTVRDVRGDLVIVGALTNRVTPAYTISNNALESRDFGILLGPARNIIIASNQFSGQSFGIGTGAGYQGKDCNGNILIENNFFTNVNTPFLVQAGGADRMENVTLRNNMAVKGAAFADGWGWSTNIFFSGNVTTNFRMGLKGVRLQGQWYLDDLSNQFPPHPLNDNIGTNNVITYALGARQQTATSKTNSTFRIDDSAPEKIPAGATLQIVHKGKFAAPLYLSTTRSNTVPVIMPASGCSVLCAWTNKAWSVVSSSK